MLSRFALLMVVITQTASLVFGQAAPTGSGTSGTKTWQKARRLASTDGGAVTYELLSQVVEGGL